MSISQLDVAIRAGAAATTLLLAWLLLNHRPRIGLPATLFLPLAICVAGFVIGNTPISSLRPHGPVADIINVVSGFLVIFLWWFCLSCFDPRFRLKGGVLVVGLFWAAIAALDRGLLGDTFAHCGLSRLLVPLGFAIVGHLVWRLLAERQGDLIRRRHDARIMVALLLGGMLFVDLAADTLFGFAWRPLAFSMTHNAMALAFAVWLAGRLMTVRPDALAFAAEDGQPLLVKRDCAEGAGRDDALHRRLSVLMDAERAFLDPELTFAMFVERMGAPERAVRTLVNQELGYDHFRTFLNHHRVAEACRLLQDRPQSDKLIAIALDSGFASLASFNRAFKAIEGCSPSAYRAASCQTRSDEPSRQQPGFEERKADF